jgi:hypothetical protein
MPDRAGSRTPGGAAQRGAGVPILSSVRMNRRAHARSLRSAKLGAPRILGAARSGMASWEFRRHGFPEGQVAPLPRRGAEIEATARKAPPQ